MRHRAQPHARQRGRQSIQQPPGAPTNTGGRDFAGAVSRAESRFRDIPLWRATNPASHQLRTTPVGSPGRVRAIPPQVHVVQYSVDGVWPRRDVAAPPRPGRRGQATAECRSRRLAVHRSCSTLATGSVGRLPGRTSGQGEPRVRVEYEFSAASHSRRQSRASRAQRGRRVR